MKSLLNNVGLSAVGLVLVVLLILFLIGSLPTNPWSHGWGYYPSGGIGLLLVVILILILVEKI